MTATNDEPHGTGHDTPLTLQEHLRELRGRLITVVLAIALGMGGGLYLADRVQRYFLDLIARIVPNTNFIETTPQEKIVVYFTIALYLGIDFAMPVIIYQAASFLAPDLTYAEKVRSWVLITSIVGCLAGGVIFALHVATPAVLYLTLFFTGPQDYRVFVLSMILNFCSTFTFWTGIAFELPLLMFLFAALNVTPYPLLRRGRKWAAVGLMVAAAVITPTPDALSMLIIWAPLYLLFEFGLILARFARPRTTPSTLALLVGLAIAHKAQRPALTTRLATSV